MVHVKAEPSNKPLTDFVGRFSLRLYCNIEVATIPARRRFFYVYRHVHLARLPSLTLHATLRTKNWYLHLSHYIF